MTWERFEELFMDRFFPQTFKDAKTREFLSLKQRSMTVMQYEAMFASLYKYTQNLNLTDKAKADQFTWGLRTDIRGRIIGMMHTSYAAAVRAAIAVEMEIQDTARLRGTTSKGPIKSQNKHARQKRGRLFENNKKYNGQPQKRNGGGSQLRFQQKDPNACYQCGQLGHLKRDCPQRAVTYPRQNQQNL